VRLLVGHSKDVRAVAYLPDGQVVSGGSDRTVRIWNPVTGELVRAIKAGTLVYDPQTGALRVRYDFGLGSVHAIAVAPDGLTFAVAGDDGLAVFDWDG
jgi:WD40 repeat protein